MNKIVGIILTFTLLLIIDFYVFQAFKVAFKDANNIIRKSIFYVYWGLTVVTLAAFLFLHYGNLESWGRNARMYFLTSIFANYFVKLVIVLFLLIDDVRRFFVWIFESVSAKFKETTPVEIVKSEGITRSEFLMKTGLVVASIPFAGMAYGIISGAHDYRVRRKTIALPNLPKSFDGLKIAQISDIHSGSFFNKTAVKGGVEMLLREKPDVVFFTGDLVNDRAYEVKDYFDIFKNVKAPLGVYSTLGNHDYGQYVQWPSKVAQIENLKTLMAAHKELGWDLLMNEHRFLKVGGESIAIMGIENWGTGRWPKYGKLDKAYKGTENSPVKLLLSHDPSHWDAQVRTGYKDIDISFAGHTHGLQFGVEIGNIKWSPSQYIYKQWAGLYQEGSQYLYVNRGYGYLGFPGRIGMPPEITIIELKKA